MQDDGNDALPQFPPSPDGLARREHLPTVEACIRYWEAVRLYAIQAGKAGLVWTSTSLRSSYELAREELKKARPVRKPNAAARAPRGRLPAAPAPDDTTQEP